MNSDDEVTLPNNIFIIKTIRKVNSLVNTIPEKVEINPEEG